MRFRITDGIIVMLTMALPLFGIVQACSGGDGPTSPRLPSEGDEAESPDNGDEPPEDNRVDPEGMIESHSRQSPPETAARIQSPTRVRRAGVGVYSFPPPTFD